MSIMNVQPVKLFITETGTADDMVGVNFNTHVTQQNFMQFNEQTHGGMMLDPTNLAGLAGEIIRPDFNQARTLQIPNGWGMKRLRFVLHMSPASMLGDSTVKYIYTGYTDTADFNYQVGDFSPMMKMYFNNAISISQSYVQTPSGLVPQTYINDISHVLTPNALGGGLSPVLNPNTLDFQVLPSTLRPTDLFTHLGAKADSERFGHQVHHFGTVVDTKKSARSNAIASNYLSKATKSLSEAIETTDVHESATDLYSKAAGFSADTYVSGDPLIAKLMELNYGRLGYVTWQDFTTLFPAAKTPGVISYIRRPDNGDIITMTNPDNPNNVDKYAIRRGENEQMITASGVNTSAHALIAYSLMQSIPGLLLTHFINRCVIVATNMTVNGGLHLEIRTPQGMTDLPSQFIMERIPALESVLFRTVFMDLPVNKEVDFFIEIFADVFGESFICVRYNGSYPVPFSFPSYCDAMMSPILAATQQPLEQMSNDIRYLTGVAYG